MGKAEDLHNKIRTKVSDCSLKTQRPASGIYVGFREWHMLTWVKHRKPHVKSRRQADGRPGISFDGIPVYRVVDDSHLKVC